MRLAEVLSADHLQPRSQSDAKSMLKLSADWINNLLAI